MRRPSSLTANLICGAVSLFLLHCGTTTRDFASGNAGGSGSSTGAATASSGGNGGPGGSSDGADDPTPLALGAECYRAEDCASGSCVDGVCCESSCDGLCMACSNAMTGEADGTCAPALAASDPHNDCSTSEAKTCGQNGFCDGMGACSKYDASTVCSDPSCTAGQKTPAGLCDGSGACVVGPTESCGNGCDGTVCSGQCEDDLSCAQNAYCDPAAGDQCVPKIANGGSCSAANQCDNGHCVDGVCCDSACNGTCQACSASAKGTGADGVCGDVVAGTDPHGSCAAQSPDTCGTTGMCNGAGACAKFPAGTACGPQVCSSGVVSGGRCTGSGTCAKTTPDYCEPYKCGPTSCKTSCTSSTDCEIGYVCKLSKCVEKLIYPCIQQPCEPYLEP